MISVLRNPAVGKSAYLGANNRERSFVIGFREQKLTDYVYQRIHPMKQPTIRNQQLVDATDEFNAYLADERKLKRFQIDTNAILTIPKHRTHLDMGVVHETYDLVNIPETKFLLFPFENYIGIAIPFMIVREDDDYIDMMTYLVDPNLFKASI